MKKREAISRNSSEQIERIQWDIEREVKKTIQNYSKRIVTLESKDDNQKIINSIKGLEDEVINVLSNKLNPSNWYWISYNFVIYRIENVIFIIYIEMKLKNDHKKN